MSTGRNFRRRWDTGHHLFFALIQDQIWILNRLERALAHQDWQTANDALTEAGDLWWSCAAAFHFTADFSREVFNDFVRPSMEPPFERAGFSGLWSADHMSLILTLGKVRPLLETLPPKLKSRHRRFLWALNAMYEEHARVCKFHAGNGASLKDLAADNATSAPDSIRDLKIRTLKNAGCPIKSTIPEAEVRVFTIKVHESVFEQEPTFCRGIVIAAGLHNFGPDIDLEARLLGACQDAADNPIDLATDQQIVAWADAFRALGSDPKRFPPAHLALRKRVQRPDSALSFINKAVAVMNLSSIAGVIPVGGDDLNRATELGDVLELRPAIGYEHFVPLGQPDREEHPEPGEVILAINEAVCCRRWCWRNGHLTRITEATTALVMNVDGLGPDSEARAMATRDRVAELLDHHCQAAVVTGVLSARCPEIQFKL